MHLWNLTLPSGFRTAGTVTLFLVLLLFHWPIIKDDVEESSLASGRRSVTWCILNWDEGDGDLGQVSPPASLKGSVSKA